MTGGAQLAEALQVLADLVRAALVWVLAAAVLATLLVLAAAAAVGKLYRLIRQPRTRARLRSRAR